MSYFSLYGNKGKIYLIQKSREAMLLTIVLWRQGADNAWECRAGSLSWRPLSFLFVMSEPWASLLNVRALRFLFLMFDETVRNCGQYHVVFGQLNLNSNSMLWALYITQCEHCTVGYPRIQPMTQIIQPMTQIPLRIYIWYRGIMSALCTGSTFGPEYCSSKYLKIWNHKMSIANSRG